MTLKETDNHSAQGIFESLMLDPDLEIGEGQTREEAAKHEAEYRARQHFNNMRALSLGTEENSVKSLLEFLSRPSSIWSTVVDIMKASFSSITGGSYYATQVPENQKLHPDAQDAVNLSDAGNKFIDFLKQNNMPAASISYISALGKSWRSVAAESGEDEDGWIKHVTASIGTHDGLSQQLDHPNNGNFNLKNQKALSKALNENGYHAHAPAPKAATINNKFFEAKKYGSNTKDALEQTATLDNVNDALQKMGRKEKVQFGGSNKLRFDETTGNVQQWKAYKEAPENDKRKHTRIVRGQIHKGASMTDEILSSQMEDFSVAEILRGLFHHTDMDGGQHDVTPEEAVQNNAKDEVTQAKLEAYDEVEEQIVTDKIAEGSIEPITDAELDKIMHQFQVSKAAEEIDKTLPFVLANKANQMQMSEDIEMHSLAQQFGLVDEGDGVVTPEHLAGIHQAIKDGVLVTGNIVKHWPLKKDANGNPIPKTMDKSGSPTHYSLVADKKGGESGVTKYINHKKAKPIVPPKTAKQIADAPTEELGEGKPVTLNEVAEMAEENNEDFPVENHVSDKVNHLQTMNSAVESLIGEMSETYMHSNYDKAAGAYSNLISTGAGVGGLFDRFWSKGDPEFGAAASENIAGRLQLNPHLIAGMPGLINNSKFVSHFDLINSPQLSPSIQQHVKDIRRLHTTGAVLNNPEMVKNLKQAGTLGATIRTAVDRIHIVASNPDVPVLGDMHPSYIIHALEETSEVFATAIASAFGGADMPTSIKGAATWLSQTAPNKFAHDFAQSLNTQHGGIYETRDELANEIDKAYSDAPYSETPDNLQGEEPNLHISGPAHVEMMNHVNNYIDAGLGAAGKIVQYEQIASSSAIKDVFQGELSSMATQPLGLKEKQQIFHNMHTALDAGIVDHGNATEDFTDITEDGKHSLNSLHNILNNTFNEEMGDPMSSGDWDAIKGYHAAKSLLDSKLAGKPINSMGALHLDNSALDALSGLGGSMAEYQDDDDLGEQLIDHPELAHNIQMFMGDLLSEYSPEDLKKLSPEVDMLHEHLEHSAYAPTGEMKNTPGYKYAQEHHGEFASQIKDDHEITITALADATVAIGELAASPYPQQGIEQHYQDALDAMHNGIQEAVASGAMTEGQAQQLATDAGVDKKHFTGDGSISTDLADTKEVNMEPDDEPGVQQSIENASHNLNIAVASGNTDAQNEASDMLTDLMDSASVHGIGENEFNELLEGHLSYDAYDMHVGGKEPSPVHSEGQSDLGTESVYPPSLDDVQTEQQGREGINVRVVLSNGEIKEQFQPGAKTPEEAHKMFIEGQKEPVAGLDGKEIEPDAQMIREMESNPEVFHTQDKDGNWGQPHLQEPKPEEEPKEDVHATVQDVKDAAQAFNEAVQIGEPEDISQANDKLKNVKKVALAHPHSNVTSAQLDGIVDNELDGKAAREHFGGKTPDKPEVEEPKVEEELDKVPDADVSQEKQKQEIMQEIFNDDFKDSDDAKTYKAYLDKQKSEKIDALHETHVIGNLVKKNIKAKADKAKQKTQSQKDEQKTSDKEEADQAKEEEKQQKEDDKAKQKEADTVPHKSGEIEKKIEEGQNPKQMARENMVHQHQHEDIMSAKANKEYTDAFHKFDAMGVDMDELLDEKDKHGDAYGSEEHLQAAMKEDSVKEDTAENYKNHIESSDHEHVKNREKAFKSGQPGKFTAFDKNGNPEKDLHHTKDKYGQSSLEEHEHGEGPKAEKFDTQTGEEHGTHTLHGEPTEDAKKYKEAEQKHKDAKDEYNFFHNEAKNLHEDLEEQKKKLDEVDDDSPDAEGEKSEINDKISQIEKDKETNLNARVEADGKRHKAQKALEELPKPKEPSEDDVPKTGPPDPEVARRKMAEGYIWHEETRSWIMRENMKAIQGGHGAKDATMIHGGSASGTKPGQMVKPFATNEDGSPSDNHFVVSHAGVHKVGSPVAKPPGASSHQHTTEASLGHALKDTKTGPNGAVHLPNAFGAGGALASSGLATAGNHVTQQPQAKGAIGSAMDSLKGGAMDKLKDIIGLEEIEDDSALDKLLVKYK